MLYKFYIICHGETYANVEKIYMEHSDLTESGIKQAKVAAEKIFASRDKLNFKTILSSPLKRAKDIAAIINDKLNLPVYILPMLSEGRIGSLDGKKHSEMTHDMWQDWIYGKFVIDGGQTFSELQNQIQIAFDEISSYENPLVVAHGGIVF